METVTLENIVPEVFASEPPADSEVWLRPVTFTKGETVLIEARSGAGKTSLASFIMGLRNDYRGTIRFDGEDIRKLTPDSWASVRSRSIGYMPQNLDLFPDLSAADNILLKEQLNPGFTPGMSAEEKARALGISRFLDRRAGKLSVGQMQRVALVRALSQPFDFLILDEPVSHLDEANNRAAAELTARAAAENGACVIVLSVGNRLSLRYTRTLLL